MRTDTTYGQRSRGFVPGIATCAAAIVRCDRRATAFAIIALPGLEPGVSVLEVLEAAASTEVEDIIEPASAGIDNTFDISIPPGDVAGSWADSGPAVNVQLPVADQRKVGYASQLKCPEDTAANVDRDLHVVAVEGKNVIRD